VLFRKVSSLLVAAFACAACASSSRNIPSYDEQAASHVRPVDLFISSRPTRPFAEQGFVEVRQMRSDTSADDALKRMRRAAAARGCDGVIFVDSSTAVSAWLNQGAGFVRTQKSFRGSCVVYTGPESASQSASARSDQPCVPNATQLCYGPGACQGAQACLADGTGYTACDCGSSAQPGVAASKTARVSRALAAPASP
jgi:hypothetical protein